MKLQTFKDWLTYINTPLNLRMAYEAGQHSILEYIHQKTDDSCPCCDSENYPVGKQIYTQNPETFQVEGDTEWHCSHDEDCLVTVIEKSLYVWGITRAETLTRDFLLEEILMKKQSKKNNDLIEALDSGFVPYVDSVSMSWPCEVCGKQFKRVNKPSDAPNSLICAIMIMVEEGWHLHKDQLRCKDCRPTFT